MNDPIHPSTGTGLSEGAVASGAEQPGRTDSRLLERVALRTCAWSERWIPDAYVFAAVAVVLVAVIAVILGATPVGTAKAFGDGFWSLIPFTMQMTFIIIGGFVVASSPPVGRLIDRVASIPRTGRAAVVWVTLVSVLLSLI